MATIVGICNEALIRLGSPTITDLTDSQPEAVKCNAIFTAMRDNLLRAHPWNFALKRQKLPKESNEPAFGYSSQFTLPADFIRVVAVFDRDTVEGCPPSYKLEGLKVLADVETVYLLYVSRVTDPNAMPPDFRHALSIRIAAELAGNLAESTAMREALQEEFRREALPIARAVDALEDSPRMIPESDWVAVRY